MWCEPAARNEKAPTAVSETLDETWVKAHGEIVVRLNAVSQLTALAAAKREHFPMRPEIPLLESPRVPSMD